VIRGSEFREFELMGNQMLGLATRGMIVLGNQQRLTVQAFRPFSIHRSARRKVVAERPGCSSLLPFQSRRPDIARRLDEAKHNLVAGHGILRTEPTW